MASQAANPDVVAVCSYPLDSVGIVKATNEINFKPKMIGGAMVGLQATGIKNQLGHLLNGWTNYETWVPDKKMYFEGTDAFFKKYQSRAQAAGVDPLGYYLGGWGYAYAQVLEQAVKGAKTLKDAELAAYIKKNTFKTIHGDDPVRRRTANGPSPACCRCSTTASSRAPASRPGAAWTTRPC